jgi:hypothetical protein
MPGPITIEDSGLVVMDPSDISVFTFDWDARHLQTSVTIATNSFSVVTLTTGAAAITKDNEVVLAGARKTQLRLSVPQLGAKYRIENKIVTNESPPQTKERSFYVVCQNK